MSLEAFFRTKARQFQDGDIETSAQDVQLPLVASISGSTFKANRLDDIITALTIYRSNLMVESYARTEITQFQALPPVNGSVQVFASYRHFNDVGAEIAGFEASFICTQNDQGAWQICQADSISDGSKNRFLSGLPLI